MKIFAFIVFLVCAGGVFAAAPSYGTLVIDESGTEIYEGADSNSQLAGYAKSGDTFELRAEKTYKGFYKIEYKGKICFVAEGDVTLQETPTPIPSSTPKTTLIPTPKPTAKATLVPTPEPEKGSDETVEAVPTAVPKVVATMSKASASVATPAPEGASKSLPILLTSSPVPVRSGNLAKDLEATRVPTPLRDSVATPVRSAAPTPAPTATPKALPTLAQTPPAARVPVPTPVAIRKAKGRSVVVAQATPAIRNPTPVAANPFFRPRPAPTQTAAKKSWIWKREPSSASTMQTDGVSLSFGSRERDQLSRLMFSLPIGWGKPYDVKPAFKPDATYLDSRNIDASVFTGLGVEYRLLRWLRLFADWNVHVHQTLAVDTKSPAIAVDVPGQTSLLADQKIYYVMQTHGFRLGGRLGLPMGRYEPWVGGGYGVYAWNVEYRDDPRSTSYGDDHGTEWGWTGQVGLDINFIWGGALFRVTPFGELGSPVVHPTVGDIAGTGSDWHDDQGTAVMVPRRLGIMFSLGY